ncbi:MAG: hypothetical protein M3Y75_01960 [Actinomycetota bacterium]|nr:hypothetical protein [Actinomycetota bacterium]
MTAAGTAGRTLAIFAFSIVSLFICVSTASAAAPANDAFANAEALPDFPGEPSGSNVEATKEAGEPSHAGNPGGHSVWFSWTPSTNRRVGIQDGNCFGTAIEPLIGVYTGPSVNSLTPVASNQGPASTCFSELPQAEFEAVAGTTYWIAVDGRNGAEGSFVLRFSSAPANDDFAGATAIDAKPPQTVQSSIRLAGKESGEPDHAGDPGGHSVWYSWTPSASEPVRISTCSVFSRVDTVLAVYTGSALGGLTPVAANDEAPGTPTSFLGCTFADSAVTIDAVAGTTYRIAVDGANGTTGRFSLRIQGRPVNDDFASAQAMLPGIPSFVSEGTNEFATKESGEPNHAGDPGGHSLWYSWTAPTSGRVRVATCSYAGGMDAVLAVYTGTELNALTPVAADQGSNSQCTFGSEVAIDVTAGTAYLIAVDGEGGAKGRFGLSIEGPPTNDDFADAKALPETPSVSTSGSTASASKESGEPNHAGNPGGRSVWFTWTAPSSGPFAISTCSFLEETPDTLLAVYTGGAVGGLTPVASNDDSSSACWEVGSEVRFQAVAGTTYRIAVDSKDGTQGIFSLAIGGRPANDAFASPEALPAEPMTAGGSTVFAGKETGEPNHAGNPGGHSLWFSWTPSSSGPVEITACGRNGVDTLLAVYTGAAVSALTPVVSNDDATGRPQNGMCESSSDSAVVLNAVAGTTYRIAVDTKDGEGSFGMGFIPVAGNDDFADADVLFEGLPSFAAESTAFATKEASEPNHAGNPGGHSVWYSWTAPSSGPVLVSTCTRDGFDTLLAVYTGSSVGSLTPIASDDDGQSRKGCGSTDSEAQFVATAGTTYRIAVDGKGGAVGSFQLTLEGTATNDDFGKAQPLGGVLPAIWQLGSNRFTTQQSGEPDHAGDAGGSSVWFKWTAPRSGTVSVDTCGSSVDTVLAVYTGSALGALTPVQSNDDGSGSCAPQSRLTFAAVANTTYRIAVDGKGGAQGPLALSIEERRGNDDFEAAEAIPGRAGLYWTGSTVLATKQAGEPNHSGDPGGRSVWFSWTPRKSLKLELDACTDSGFEPLLAVYTGSAVGALTPAPTSDEGSGECEEGGSSVGFDAVAGTTYRFAVDGPGGDEGRFELHLRSIKTTVTPPTEPPTEPPPGNPGGGGATGGGAVPPIAGPLPGPPQPKKPPKKCKRGFKKKVVKGKPRCVKKKKKAKKKKRR